MSSLLPIPHPSPEPAPDPLLSTVIAEKYLVVQRIGEGGMGRVYEVVHTQLGVARALKLITDRPIRDTELARKRFFREMQTMARVVHPNIARVLDGGIAADGLAYFVMDLVPGEQLTTRLASTPQPAWDESVEILRQLAAALDALHVAGIVHRDLKPSNVMVWRRGEGRDVVWLIDFGLAKRPDIFDETLTEPDRVPGTPIYMSPEQLDGDPLTSASDRYALALIAFELLTGVRPFPDDNADARCTRPPLMLGAARPEVEWPAATQAVMLRALALDPKVRFASAGAFVDALAAALKVTGSDRVGQHRGSERLTADVQAAGDLASVPTLAQRSPPPGRAGESSAAAPPPAQLRVAGAAPRRPLYAWERLWVPRGGSVSLSGRGYLAEPMRSKWGFDVNADLVPLSELESVPALVLLGEPGIGKSTEVDAARRFAELAAAERGDANLRDYASDERLHHEVFGHPRVGAWQRGTHRLTLFLDSLDEGLLELRPLATRVLAELRALGPDRLAVRVACRTAEWPMVLERGLQELWGEANVAVYELAMLREQDVRVAAEAEGIADVDTFLRALDDREVIPFATRPVTLRFLITAYRARGGQLPASQATLYEEGCRRLAAELSESRLAAGRTGQLTPDERLAVAARIAAVMVFGNRAAVTLTLSDEWPDDADLAVRELAGGREDVGGVSVAVDEIAVRETLATALFSARGPARLGWAHQTYAEFLAAWYVAAHRAPLSGVRRLLTVSADRPDALVPQLHETTGWLAAMRDDVREWVMTAEPEVLIRGDIATGDPAVRGDLVRELLRLADEGELPWRLSHRNPRYRNLRYPGLTNQLRAVIHDEGRGDDARELATAIAASAELAEMADDFATLAVNPTAPAQARKMAAAAIVDFGSRATRARLRTLAEAGIGNQSYADELAIELKGYALQALWPEVLSTAEVFPLLVAPHETIFGSYRRFLRDFSVALAPSDLIPALAWTAQQSHPGRVVPGAGVDDVTERVLLLAWEHLDRPGVFDAFTDVASTRLHQHLDIVGGDERESFAASVAAQPERRRRLVAALVRRLQSAGDAWHIVHLGGVVLLDETEVPWLIEQLDAAPAGSAEAEAWAELIRRVYRSTDPELFARVYAACERHPALARQCAPLFDPIVLDSPAAEELRESERLQERYRRQREDNAATPKRPSVELAEAHLRKAEEGDPDAWWHLNYEFAIDEDGRMVQEGASDLTARPLWTRLNTELRARVVAGADRYLRCRDAEPTKWLGKSHDWRPAKAGYRALLLLSMEAPDRLDRLPSPVWAAWAPVIVAFCGSSEHAETQRDLLTRVWRDAPEPVLATARAMLTEEDRAHRYLLSLDGFVSIQDTRFNAMLFALAQDAGRSTQVFGQLVSELLRREAAGAPEYLISLAESPPPTEGRARERALAAARALLQWRPGQVFDEVWSAVAVDPAFSRELVESMASRSKWPFGPQETSSSGNNGEAVNTTASFPLVEHQLGVLFQFLAREYPRDTDPSYTSGIAHEVTARDNLGRWRDGALQILAQQGTPAAVQVLEELRRVLPQDAVVAQYLREGRAAFRRNAWTPPEPRAVLRLVSVTTS
jgi:hypothetical protein